MGQFFTLHILSCIRMLKLVLHFSKYVRMEEHIKKLISRKQQKKFDCDVDRGRGNVIT